MSAPAAEALSRSVVDLLMEEPFFGHLLGGLARRFTDALPTAGVVVVEGGVALWINPSFFMGLGSDNERTAVLKHEALHLALRHLLRPPPREAPRLLFNVAADLVVNQFIGERWSLPAGAVTLDRCPDLDLEPDSQFKIAMHPGRMRQI